MRKFYFNEERNEPLNHDVFRGSKNKSFYSLLKRKGALYSSSSSPSSIVNSSLKKTTASSACIN